MHIYIYARIAWPKPKGLPTLSQPQPKPTFAALRHPPSSQRPTDATKPHRLHVSHSRAKRRNSHRVRDRRDGHVPDSWKIDMPSQYSPERPAHAICITGAPREAKHGCDHANILCRYICDKTLTLKELSPSTATHAWSMRTARIYI